MFRFLIRFLGLTGLLAAAAGALVLDAQAADWNVTAEMAGEQGVVTQVGAILLVAGGAAAILALLVELLSAAQSSAGRRSVLGGNVVVQVILAAALLVAVNVWSFAHYKRWDCTREGVFTLKSELKEKLSNLRDETTVVVYQMHKTFGRFSDKPPDEYDTAAEAKVVEKVKDLVDQLRELGSRFRVVVLDVQHRDFDRKLADEVRHFPKLADAVKAAPENSIFFCSGDQVARPGSKEYIQRLGFNEFYQLDKTGSQEANGGRGNLTLLYQGVEPFARRVLAVEEKRPRVAVAVSHPWLSTEGPIDEYTLAGLKKSLTNYGFDVRDIILKKLVGRRGRGTRLENSALTTEESKFDQLEAQIQPLRAQIQAAGRQLALARDILDLLKSRMSNEDLTKELAARGAIPPTSRTMDDDLRKQNVDRLTQVLDEGTRDVESKRQRLAKREQEFEQLQTRERVAEGQRVTDLKKKMEGLLAECDMLIVARMTLRDLGAGDVVPNFIHTLDDSQLAAIKDFMKAGKPVLFCFGPTNESPESGSPTPPADNLETMLSEVGLVFAPQTVLYDSESDAIAASQAISFGRAVAEDVPPVDFSLKVNVGGVVQTAAVAPPKPNPIAESVRLTKRSAGQPLDLRMRHPRPIYFHTLTGAPSIESAFVLTAPQSWNEDQPFPTEDRPVPQFDLPKSSDPNKKQEDPNKGTRFERRRGPFPIGVAVETTLPVQWYNDRIGAEKAALLAASAVNIPGGLPMGVAAESLMPTEDLVPKTPPEGYVAPKKIRLAAIGHGGWFAGAKLSPADETLLVNTTDWLLRRDDRLPHADRVWDYPRVDLSDRDRTLWQLSTFAGLPVLFAYLGMVVLLVRRIR
jgi:hypothetical protein